MSLLLSLLLAAAPAFAAPSLSQLERQATAACSAGADLADARARYLVARQNADLGVGGWGPAKARAADMESAWYRADGATDRYADLRRAYLAAEGADTARVARLDGIVVSPDWIMGVMGIGTLRGVASMSCWP